MKSSKKLTISSFFLFCAIFCLQAPITEKENLPRTQRQPPEIDFGPPEIIEINHIAPIISLLKKQLGALKTKRNEASIMSKSFPVRFLSFKVITRLKARLVSFSNPRRVRSKDVFSKTCTDHSFLCLFTHQIILEFGRGHNHFLQTKKRPRGHAIFFFCYASS